MKKVEKKQTGVRIPADILKKLKHLSIDLDRPFSDLVAEAMQDLVKKYEKKRRGE